MLCAISAWGADEIVGKLGSPQLSSDPDRGVQSWPEQLVFVSPRGEGRGDADWSSTNPRGAYDLSIPNHQFQGEHAVFTVMAEGLVPFAYQFTEVPCGDGQHTQDLVVDGDYVVMYPRGAEDWGPEKDHWLWGGDFYQTFVARSRHITRASTRLAGKRDHVTKLNFQLVKVGEGPPSSWEPVSPVRTTPLPEPIYLFTSWVAWHSEEVDLIPGEQYALHLWCPQGPADTHDFALVARRDRGDGYTEGRLYEGDTPIADPGRDMFGYFGGDVGNNTLVNYGPVRYFDLPGELVGWNTSFGQTFTATGEALAGAEVVVAPLGDLTEPVTFQLYDRVGGEPIGPSKTCWGAPGPFQSRVGAFWYPGEAPLEPGKQYYLECSSAGINTWDMRGAYLGGALYVDRRMRPGRDLRMVLAEYETLAED
jgi:hypothetical protein